MVTKYPVSVLLAVLLCGVAFAQDHSSHNQSKPATLMSGLGDLHHPVSTRNAEAQQFFDQGLRLIYAFNHDEAARSFQRAAELDPSWPWHIGVSPKPWDPTTTTLPVLIASGRRTRPSRRRLISQPMPRPASRPTSRRWLYASRRIPNRTCARRPRITTMPCARCQRNIPTTWTRP